MATEESTKFVPNAERVELAAQIIQKSYMIGRALETMQGEAFEDKNENDPALLYRVASKEFGCRVRALSDAANRLLTDSAYDLGDAWVALHA